MNTATAPPPPVNLAALPDRFPPVRDDGMWGLDDIAVIAGVTVNAVWAWRRNTLSAMAGKQTWNRYPRRTLPVADNQAAIDAGETTVILYRPETIIPWMQRTGRLDRGPEYKLLEHSDVKHPAPLRAQMSQIERYLRRRGLSVQGEHVADTVERLLDVYVPDLPTGGA